MSREVRIIVVEEEPEKGFLEKMMDKMVGNDEPEEGGWRAPGDQCPPDRTGNGGVGHQGF